MAEAEQTANKLRNAAALTGHMGWVVFPLLSFLAFRRSWVFGAVGGAAALFIDPHPLYWISAGAGVMVLAHCAREWKRFETSWVLLFFADDLSYYWFHRCSHESRFFWASHVVHHSSTHYNLSTALRQTWVPMTYLPFWLWMPAVFAAMALGPFVHVAGINTYIPGPWAVLRYVPVVGLARSPSRFASNQYITAG